MYNGSYYANKIKNTIDKIGETVTLNYKIRQGYDPISGETYENFTVNDFKMLIRKTDKTDYVKIPEGLHNNIFVQQVLNSPILHGLMLRLQVLKFTQLATRAGIQAASLYLNTFFL